MAALALDTDVQEGYEIPSALAVSARLTTYLDVTGGQRTEAVFEVANAGQQFLTMRLPDGAELVSIVTRSSAEGLGLAPGADAWAVVKASNVMIATD